MIYKITITIFLLIPLFVFSQTSPQWTLFLNKKKLLTSSLDSAANLEIPVQKNSVLLFSFPKRNKSFTRSLLLMNEARNTLLKKKLAASSNTVSLTETELLSKTEKKPFTVYIIDIPSDPAKAALVRVVPVPICHIFWK